MKRNLPFITLLTWGSVAFSALCQAQTQWIHQAPNTLDRKYGGVFGIDANRAWIVGGQETVAETKDGGQTWTIHHSSNYDSSPLLSVVFSGPNIGYIAGNGPTTLRTDDAGSTLTKYVGVTSALQAYKFDYVSSTTCFATYGGPLAKTTDNWLHWAGVYSPDPINIYGMDFRTETVGLAVGENQNFETGIYRTTDGGQSWARTYPNAPNAIFYLDGVNAIAVEGQNVLHSSDDGQSWFPYGFIETADTFVLQRFAGTNILVSITSSGDIFRSENLGMSWQKVHSGLGYPLSPDRNANIHCANSTAAWAVVDPGVVLRSVDQGLTWQQVNNGGFVTINDMKMFSESFGIATASPGYTLTTHNAGKSWKVRKHTVEEVTAFHEEGLEVVDIVDESFAAVAGRGGVVFKTEDGGENWSSIGYPVWSDRTYFWAIDFVDRNLGWVAGYDYDVGEHKDNLYKTTDGGANWTLVHTNTEAQGFFQAGGFAHIQFLNAQKGFLVGTSSNPTMIKTLNGGTSWTPVILPSNWSPPFVSDIEFRNANEGWITGGSGYVCRTLDGGATWTKLNVGPLTDGYSSVVFPGPNKVWLFGGEVAFQRPFVLKSNDGGATWVKERLESYRYAPSASAALPDGRVWYGTGRGSIFTTAAHMVPAQLAGGSLPAGTVSGSIKNTVESDNIPLSIKRQATSSLESMQVTLDMKALRTTPNEMRLNVETRCIGSLATEKVELYNWQTRSWDRVQMNGMSSSDETYRTHIHSRAFRYVDPKKGLIRIRMTLTQDDVAFAPEWEYQIDQVSILLSN